MSLSQESLQVISLEGKKRRKVVGGSQVQAKVSSAKRSADLNGKIRCSDKCFSDRELWLS